MTEVELMAATEKLKAWLITEKLTPANAGEILTKLFARQLVSTHNDVGVLNLAINLFHNQMVMEVAKAIEERNETRQ